MEQREKRPRKIRKEFLPVNLPVRTEEIIPEFVQANPTAWRNSGFEEKTQLEKEPAYFYLRRILRLKFVPIDNPFNPLVGLMKQRMLEGNCVGADETFIRYFDKLIPGGSSTGYFWVNRGLTGEVIFDWLGPDYQGILQSDGYQAYGLQRAGL